MSLFTFSFCDGLNGCDAVALPELEFCDEFTFSGTPGGCTFCTKAPISTFSFGVGVDGCDADFVPELEFCDKFTFSGTPGGSTICTKAPIFTFSFGDGAVGCDEDLFPELEFCDKFTFSGTPGGSTDFCSTNFSTLTLEFCRSPLGGGTSFGGRLWYMLWLSPMPAAFSAGRGAGVFLRCELF